MYIIFQLNGTINIIIRVYEFVKKRKNLCTDDTDVIKHYSRTMDK